MALKDLSIIEQRIIWKILDNIDKLEQPVAIEIWSGGQDSDLKGDYNRAEVSKYIGVSDETVLKIYDGDARAWVLLVHGNEEDVISDSGSNAVGGEMHNLLFEFPV